MATREPGKAAKVTTSSHPSTPDQTQRVPKGPASLPFPEPPSGFGRDEDIRRSWEGASPATDQAHRPPEAGGNEPTGRLVRGSAMQKSGAAE